eukprot:SM000046S16411  [mRNA]  locus=s46:512971:514362:+ [translate_table: standard]
MARPVALAVVALVLSSLLASAAAHYCTVTGKVYCDACHDGKLNSPDTNAVAAQVELVCDWGRGGPLSTVFARTGADGTYTFNNVQTEQNFATFKGCTIRLVKTASKTCNILGKAGPLQVLDPVKGVKLQFGQTYTMPNFSFLQNVKPATCAICAKGGSLCGDPRLVGGDGVPFWFHGEKDGDFCIVSDRNLHVNAHFIGKASEKGHDLTWVQALAIMFGDHTLYVGTQQEAVWNSHADHLLFTLDGEVLLEVSNTGTEAVYQSKAGDVKVTRSGKANVARVEVENLLAMNVEARPIGRSQWTEDSCFAHLDMSFEFAQLSGVAEGVLGQTYQRLWSPPNVKEGESVSSYILHDVPSYTSSSLFASDCPVSIFEALPYDVRQSGAGAHKLAVMDDAEETDEIASTLCANDKTTGGLKCSTSRR